MVNRRLSLTFRPKIITLGVTAAIAILLFAGVSATAVPSEEWNKTYGGKGNDYIYSVLQTSDGGYIIAGETNSFEAIGTDAWLIKTDGNGSEEWNKTFGGWGTDVAHTALQISDGGYILAGDTSSYGAGWDDAWLIKTDADGNEQWNRTFGGESIDSGYSVQQTTDGGYILGGDTYSYGPSWWSDAWLIKTDLKGVEEWNRTFGGTGGERSRSVQQSSDGGYILAGSQGLDAWLLKADSNGVEEWNRTFGDSDTDNNDDAYSVQQTTDGGYILISSYDTSWPDPMGDDMDNFTIRHGIWLIKTDSNGNEEWIKTFGCEYLFDYEFNIPEGVMVIEETSTIQQTTDGGYVFTALKPIGSLGEGHYDAVLVKIEGEEGATGTSTPGFEIFTAISSAAIIAVILILRRRV
ncbi:MAG: hypothetical protein SVM80_07250 [Halobacteriota archaeon]|nr:hypothetical protein [Halobacteriota archaeon]